MKAYTSTVRRGRKEIAVTVFLTVIVLFLCSMPLWGPLSTLWITLIGILTLTFYFGISSVKVTADEKSLIISRIIGKVVIPYTTIEHVELMPTLDLSWQLAGSSGFRGYNGIFRSRTLGKFTAYVGRKQDIIALRLTNGRFLAFSCLNPEQMTVEIEKRLTSI